MTQIEIPGSRHFRGFRVALETLLSIAYLYYRLTWQELQENVSRET